MIFTHAKLLHFIIEENFNAARFIISFIYVILKIRSVYEIDVGTVSFLRNTLLFA